MYFFLLEKPHILGSLSVRKYKIKTSTEKMSLLNSPYYTGPLIQKIRAIEMKGILSAWGKICNNDDLSSLNKSKSSSF